MEFSPYELFPQLDNTMMIPYHQHLSYISLLEYDHSFQANMKHTLNDLSSQPLYPSTLVHEDPANNYYSMYDTSSSSILTLGYLSPPVSPDDSLFYGSNGTSSPLLSDFDYFNLPHIKPTHSSAAYNNDHSHLMLLLHQNKGVIVQPTTTTTIMNSQISSLLIPANNNSGKENYSNSSNSSISSSAFRESIFCPLENSAVEEKTPKKVNAMYRCEYKGCTKTFTRTYNLKSHRRTHTDEKPFVCLVCSKAFARQHDRNRHAKLHLGLKPYPCQFCNKSFARQDALNRHLKRDSKKKGIHEVGTVDDHLIRLPPCLLIKLRKKRMALLKKNN